MSVKGVGAVTEVLALTQAHPLWHELIEYARSCPWRAGPYLAREMDAGHFIGWERVFCLLVDGEIAGFCNLTEKDEILPEYPFSPFIGFVYVAEKFRGNRYSQKMIDAVMTYVGEIGFSEAYLMSGETGLYEKYGFRMIGTYPTIFGKTDLLFVRSI